VEGGERRHGRGRGKEGEGKGAREGGGEERGWCPHMPCLHDAPDYIRGLHSFAL